MFEQISVAFGEVMQIGTLLYILMGVCVGILFGASPGLSTSMGMAFMLPITFFLPPMTAISLLIGLYIGGASGGLITAILINIPGTPACVATTFDGYPMAQKGEPGKALGLGIVCSFIGGMISLVALIFLSPSLARIALQFGPCEYFAVSLFSLTLIAGLSGDSLLKGLASGMVGLMLATIGTAPLDATARFTMGMAEFSGGIEFLCVLVGIYTVTELLSYAESGRDIEDATLRDYKIKGMGVTREDYRGQWWNVMRSALIGMGIGILPGIGGGTSNLLAYSAAKNSSKYPEKFGTGIKDGIIASETANNAVTGAAIIPLLSLGIPGDAGTAILLAGLMIHNITPGPLLFQKNGVLVYGVFIALLVANVMMIAVEYFGMRIFLRLVRIPKYYLLATVFILCVIGAYGQNTRLFDVWSILFCGLIGYALQKFDFPLTPLIMGFILGPYVEVNLLRGLMFTKGSFGAFLHRPITAVFLGITALYLLLVLWKTYKTYKTAKTSRI